MDHDESDELAALRHRRKMNKRRLRADQKAKTERLAEEIKTLQADIAALETHLSDVEEAYIEARPKTDTVASHEYVHDIAGHVIRHYVELFRHGWQPSLEPALHEVVHPDVMFMGRQGRQYLVMEWERCSQYYDDFCIELISTLPVHPRNWIATLNLTLRMTSLTLHTIYPHVVLNQPLARKLISTPLQLEVQCHVWFDQHFKVNRLDPVVGWAAGLLAILESPEDVAAVLSPMAKSSDLGYAP